MKHHLSRHEISPEQLDVDLFVRNLGGVEEKEGRPGGVRDSVTEQFQLGHFL